MRAGGRPTALLAIIGVARCRVSLKQPRREDRERGWESTRTFSGSVARPVVRTHVVRIDETGGDPGAGGMGRPWRCCSADPLRRCTCGRDPARAAELAGRGANVRHLPGVTLPDSVEVTPNACDATGGADLIVAAIPSAFLRATLAAWPSGSRRGSRC